MSGPKRQGAGHPGSTQVVPSQARASDLEKGPQGSELTTPPEPAVVPEQRLPPLPVPAPAPVGTELLARHPDRAVRRALDDLVDDWHRAGGMLRYEDVTRLASKRELSAEQVADVLAGLDDSGVEVEGLAPRGLEIVNDSDQDDRFRAASTLSEKSSDVVRDYLRAIRRYPLLTAEDEVRLGRQIRAGLDADVVLRDTKMSAALLSERQAGLVNASSAGRRAHAELVCANLRLVVSIAKNASFHSCGVELIDRIQDGNAGLMHAADKYDATLGYKFSTYATWWIRQAIFRGIADRGRLVRLPVHVYEKVQQVRRARGELAGRLDRDPTSADIAERLCWEPAAVQALLDLSHPVVSLDVLVGTDGDTTLGDLLSDKADVDGRTDPVDCVIESACVRDIDRTLRVLDGRAAEIIRRRFGLRTGEKEPLDAIGLDFGVTRERIRQIEVKAIEQLQQSRNNGHLRSYLYDDEDGTPVREQRSQDGPRRARKIAKKMMDAS